MTNRPNNPNSPGDHPGSPPEGQSGGGWRQPGTSGTGGWRVPERAEPQSSNEPPAESREAPPAAPEPRAAWRLPTLPRNLEVTPQESGAWHRPKPEDTRLTESDSSVIASDQVDEAVIPPGAEFITTESTASDAASVPAQASETSAEPTLEVLPFDASDDTGAAAAVGTPADESSSLERMSAEEEDEGSLSMSELIALANLAEQQIPQRAETAPAAEEAAPSAVDPNDPAAYAREQLARLQAMQSSAEASSAAEAAGVESAPVSGVSGDTSAGQSTSPFEAGTEDSQAADYARQQLARIADSQRLSQAIENGLAGSQPVAATPLTPAEEVLAAKYRNAQTQIRALRDQYQAGMMSREQLQNELRNYMVLDDQNRYWMMGIESDSWYVYENNQWMLRTPDVLSKQEASRASVAQGASVPLPPQPTGASLPYLPDQQAAAREAAAREAAPFEEGATVPTSPIYSDMPLPRAVPVRDPEATIPGTQGVYLGEQDPNATVVATANPYNEATVPMGATLPNPRTAGGYESVESPIPEAPRYDVNQRTPTYEQALEDQRARTFRTVGIVIAAVAALLFLVAAGVIILGVVTYRNIATPYEDRIIALANYRPAAQTARILASDGTQIAELVSRSGGARQHIELANISPELIHAIVSVENERFFEDPGFDPIAIGRALVQNLSAGGIESGASTITQQIARNLVLQDTTVSADRKLQEIVIAAEIAQRYDKNFILELYLNEVYFGNQSYGVEAAAQFYFGKSAADVNLAEAALLAGLIQAPATYDPVVNRQAAFDRMDTVLNLMASVGCLQFTLPPYNTPQTQFCVTQQMVTGPQLALDKAQVEVRNYAPRTYNVRYPHFVNYVQAVVERAFGSPEEIFRRGMTITTTLNPALQQISERALDLGVNQLAANAVDTGAILVSDPTTGAILAMVGSPDFSNDQIDGQVNNVFTWQQPGSSIKPILYTSALEGVNRNGTQDYYTPATILWDVPVTYNTVPPYSPVNFDSRFHGPIALRYALQNSYNVPAVKTLEWLGIDAFRATADRMGLRFLPEATFGLPTALGATEVRLYDMVQAYGTLANNGTRAPLYSITSITDADGNAVTLPSGGREAGSQQVQPQIAYLMQSMLSDNEARSAAFGANSGLAFTQWPGQVAAKTGTSSDNRDLWTMGFTNNFVVGVWVGRHDNNPTINTTQTSAIPVWNAIMNAALTAARPSGWAPPTGVVQMQVCGETGTLYDPSVAQCRTVRTEVFAQSQLPPQASQGGYVQTLQIDQWTGLIANTNCPNNTITRQYLRLSDSSAVAWLLNTAEGRTFAQQNGLPTDVPPTSECPAGYVPPQLAINTPTENQTVTETITINGTVVADNFSRYQIELAPAGTQDYRVIAGPYAQQGQNGNIGQWDSRSVTNGNYTMRLAVFSNSGGVVYFTRAISVNNIPPTPTPTPTTPPPTFAPFTPLPFDTPISGQSQIIVPTATPSGFIPLGQLSPLGPTPTPEF